MKLIQAETRAVFERLWTYLRPHRSKIGWAMLAMIGTALTEVMFAKIMRYILDHGFNGDPQNLAQWKAPAAIIIIFMFRGICTYSTSYLMSWVSTRLQNLLRSNVFERILHVPIDFYHAESSSRIINTIMFETQQIVDMLKTSITTLFRDSLTVIALLAALIYINWQLTIIAFIMMPVMTVLVRKVSLRLRKLNQNQLEMNNELTQVIEEATRAAQVIRIFGGQGYEQARFEAKNEKLRGYAMRTTIAVATTTPLTQLAAAVAVAVVIMFAVAQAHAVKTTPGQFIEFLTLMMLLLTPLKRLADLNGPMQRGLAAAESVFGLIDTQPEADHGQALAQRTRGQLEFIATNFQYPGKAIPALQDIHLHIAPGQTVALVGMSGGGKTTLANLVPRFYSTTGGDILLDGCSLQDISLPSLRAQIAMVSQHVVLFDDTLAANIAYGDSKPTPERIAAAVQAAHLTDIIAALPEGLQTQIGDNGMRLSGGQRQRLAIARAIYKDAPILILDEATSALDSESERAVQTALDALMRGRTTLVIAHRLSTIERADLIVVLAEGRIIEQGQHAELLAKQGMYANLHRLQFTT